MRIIAGLGNPGAKYAFNRHNIGFMAVDAIHRKHPFSPWSKKFKSEIAEGEIGGEKVLLMKPQTFMNLSGEAVGDAMRFFKLGPADIIVLHDELDLPAAKVRVKTGGGCRVQHHIGNFLYALNELGLCSHRFRSFGQVGWERKNPSLTCLLELLRRGTVCTM